MIFAYDSELALAQTAALINTCGSEGDTLKSWTDLEQFLDHWQFSGPRTGTDQELDDVRSLRGELRRFWTEPDRNVVASLVNDILAEANAQPYLSKHDQWDWHLHLTRPEAGLSDRLAAEAAIGLIDLVREDELPRLKICAAEDCQDVMVDLSRNSSKLYCDTGNCGNRANVAAYRARKRSQSR